MKIRNPRSAGVLQFGLVAILLAGCRPAQQLEPVSENAKAAADDAHRVADEALGKQAEVLAHGNLARNDLEQVLVINRFSKAPRGGAGLDSPAGIFLTRAAILQKSGTQWTEVLRCDEHLKNPMGYLGGSPSGRVSGWRLEFKTDTRQGLEMKFTPANFEAGEQDSGTGEPVGQTVVVRWNKEAKRYQALDASHERYLSEAPSLETPHSILR